MRYIRLEWGNFHIFHVPSEKVSNFAGYLRHMVCRKQVQSSHPFWPFAGNFNWLVSHVRRPGFSLNFWDDTDIVLSAFHKLRARVSQSSMWDSPTEMDLWWFPLRPMVETRVFTLLIFVPSTGCKFHHQSRSRWVDICRYPVYVSLHR